MAEASRLTPPSSALYRNALPAGFYTVLAALLLAPNLAWPYHDAAIFMALGEGLVRGDLPYRDLWDHKPPGIYVIAGAGALLPGPTWSAFWGLSVVAIALVGIVLARVVGVGLAAVAVVAIAIYPSALGGGQTETFATLPAVGALVAARDGHPARSGVLAAVAMAISFQTAALLPALLVFSGRTRYLAALGVAGAMLGLAVAVLGVLPTAYDALVTYSRVYLRSTAGGDPAWHLLVVLAAPMAGIAGRTIGWRPSPTRWAALIWLVLGLALIALQGRQLGHYATPLVVPAIVLATPASRAVLVSGIVAALAAVALTATVVDYRQTGPATTAIGEWIAERSEVDDRILVWGVEANTYLVADRRPAGRYPYLMPLVTHGYSSPERVRSWVATLRQDPPRYIVDAEAANPHWPERGDFLRPPPPGAAGGRDLDALDPFREFVREQYELVTEIADRKVYALTDPAP